MIDIRIVSEEEQQELYEVVQQYWTEIMPSAPVVQDPLLRPRYFESEFQSSNPERYQFWALLDNEKIGFANIALSVDHMGKVWAEIKDFYIKPQWRRHGYGRAFVEVLRGWMKNKGIYRIDLHVRQDAPAALAFWQSLGFQLASYRLREYIEQ